MSQMRVIPASKLFIDPDVQLEFAVKESHWRRMGADWHPQLAGFLVVVPDGNGKFSIIDGRHRFKGGTVAGVTEWRCDVHDEIDYKDADEKAYLKLGFDYNRRHVSALEHFIERVIAKDPVAVEINNVITGCGFEIGSTGYNNSPRRVAAVSALERHYRVLGSEKFRREIQLATHWLGDPSSTHADWFGGLGLLVRDGYDEALTPSSLTRLKAAIPAIVLRRASGEVARRGIITATSGGGTGGFSMLSYEVARSLRRTARLRSRPVVRSGKGSARGKQI